MGNAAALPPGRLSGRVAPRNPDTALRPLTAADEAFARKLFQEERGAQFAPLGLNGAMLTALLDQQYRAQQAGYRAAFPQAERFVIEHRGKAAGQLMTALVESAGELTLHLIDITVSTDARGRGIGIDVVAALEQAACASGAIRFQLAVLDGNEAARRLYQRLGFIAVDAGAGSHIGMVKALR